MRLFVHFGWHFACACAKRITKNWILLSSMLWIAKKNCSNKIENLYRLRGIYFGSLTFAIQFSVYTQWRKKALIMLESMKLHTIWFYWAHIFEEYFSRIFVADSELDAPKSLLSIELNVNKQNVQIAICAKLIYLCDFVGNKSWIDKSDSHQQLQWMTFGWHQAKKKKSEKCAWLMSRAQHSTITQNEVVYWNIYMMILTVQRSHCTVHTFYCVKPSLFLFSIHKIISIGTWYKAHAPAILAFWNVNMLRAAAKDDKTKWNIRSNGVFRTFESSFSSIQIITPQDWFCFEFSFFEGWTKHLLHHTTEFRLK